MTLSYSPGNPVEYRLASLSPDFIQPPSEIIFGVKQELFQDFTFRS